MAITAGEIRYLLSLDPKNFQSTIQKVLVDEQQKRKSIERPFVLSANVKGVIEGLGKIGLAFNGLQQIYRTFAGTAQSLNQSFLEEDKAVRKLEGAAKLTGTALSQLQEISSNIKVSFELTTSQANNFVVAANKLAQAAGEQERTEELLRRLFDLAAGQGLNATEALLRFEQAIKGIDEGTEALFSGKNPIDLYREFGDEIGVSATKMTDMQKKQAILNAVMRDGAKLQGSYTEFLKSAAGQQQLAAARAEQLRAQLGGLLNEVYIPLLQLVTPLVEAFTELDEGTRQAAFGMGIFLVATVKLQQAFVALRRIIGLSSGPLGIIILLAVEAAAAFALYTTANEDASEATDKLTESNKDLAESFQKALNAAAAFFTSKSTEEVIAARDRANKRIKAANDELVDIEKKTAEELTDIDRQRAAELRTKINEETRFTAALEQILKDRQARQQNALSGLTDKEIDELDKLREFQFQTNRISLAQYVSYLEQRQAVLKNKLGEDKVEYLKFVDELNKLRVQLKVEIAADALDIPEQLQIRQPEAITQEIQQVTEFKAITIRQLEEEYNARRTFQEQRIEDARRTAGEDTEIYRQAVEEKISIEQQFQQRKSELEQGRVFTTTDIQQLEQTFNIFKTFQEQRIEEARRTAGEDTQIYRQAVEEKIAIEQQFQQRRQELAFRQSFTGEFEQVIAFRALTIEQLEQEFNARRTFQELRIQEARRVAGEESKIYDQAIQERINLEEQFQQRKFELSLQTTVSGEFQADTFDALQAEYDQRLLYANLYIELAEDTFTKESDQYRKAIQEKINLENNFQKEKTRLTLRGVQSTLALSSELMGAAQGQSKFLFDVGKLSSIATATINTFEAATKALTLGPIVGPLQMAAILALGFAQVTRIASTNFEPPAVPGFAEGSRGPLTPADLFYSFLTPPGEHGIIGAQIGETIINQSASRDFPNTLRAMNEGRYNLPDIPGFQSGGVVGGTTRGPSPTLTGGPGAPAGITKEDLDRMIEAIANIQINISAQLDAMRFFKENFPKFEKNRNERRIT